MNRSQRLVLAPAEHILPTPDPLVAFAAYPAFGMARNDALDIYEGIVDGLATVREALDAHDVPSKDRATLTNWWHRVYSPPAVSELPESRLVRPSRSSGGDPVERLAELGVEFSPDTHNVRKVGRGIALYRKDSGQLDNVPGMPARVRDAWTTSPRMEFFRNGILVSSGQP
ncbi:hypothetical protein [Acidisphaera sp. S103]|uniref:hypothetical protein n=1 Tax=Acidisphaera sp. S103 TaxID=1747223 RepID=UPI0020B11309